MRRSVGGEPFMAHVNRPLMTIVHGDGMTAKEAAWAMLADTATEALKLPGLDPCDRDELERAWAACRRAAGLPDRRRPQESRLA